MSGNGSKIEIFKPFGEAFELMKRILFQPFDFKKWLVVGFAAWLASLGGGGGSFNYQPAGGGEIKKVDDAISQIPHPVLVAGIVLVIVVVLILIAVFAWLRARGGFMFIDCIVKNRGAPLVLPAIQNDDFLRSHDVYLISAFGAWILVMILFVLAWALIGSFMIPIMYRQRCGAWQAFTLVIRLIAAHGGEILLYCLFWIVLALASAMVGCVAACATCCIVAIPYVGTVILLPVFVLLRSFSLLFLRQFGPEYDVWTTSMPPEFAPVLLPIPAAPPPPSSPDG